MIEITDTDRIWLALDKTSGKSLTPKATTCNVVSMFAKRRSKPTALRTVATHEPGEDVDPQSLQWML